MKLDKAVASFKGLNKQLPQPVVRALNRTAAHIKTFAAREVAKHYTLKVRDANSMMKIRPKASATNLNTAVHAESRLLTPYHFKFTPTSGITSKKGGGIRPKATVTIKKGNKQVLRHAFVAVVKGVRNVYIRQNKSRSSMVGLRSASLPQMIQNKKVSNVIFKDMTQFYEKNFLHEFEFLSKKAGFK